jgi:hypothetical protein
LLTLHVKQSRCSPAVKYDITEKRHPLLSVACNPRRCVCERHRAGSARLTPPVVLFACMCVEILLCVFPSLLRVVHVVTHRSQRTVAVGDADGRVVLVTLPKAVHTPVCLVRPCLFVCVCVCVCVSVCVCVGTHSTTIQCTDCRFQTLQDSAVMAGLASELTFALTATRG